MRQLSVIVPAKDEERLLPGTLAAIARAAARVPAASVEVLVVDHRSTDATAQAARAGGARVVPAEGPTIAAVRNTGARAASGDVLVFVDADVAVPEHALERVILALDDASCAGGYPDVVHRPAKRAARLYLALYRRLGRVLGTAQGSMQFCRRMDFNAVDGYDEAVFMGEDVDFVWRLGAHAAARGGHVRRLDDVRVEPSARRFDSWPLWRTLLLTNPAVVRPLMRRGWAWSGWYRRAPR